MEEKIVALVPTRMSFNMTIPEIFCFLRACKFDPHRDVCNIHQLDGYMTVSRKN